VNVRACVCVIFINKGLQLGELEKDINECVLLHGTTADAVSAIAQNGIDLRLANPSGRYGSGIYLAESSVKSNMYTGEWVTFSKVHCYNKCYNNYL